MIEQSRSAAASFHEVHKQRSQMGEVRRSAHKEPWRTGGLEEWRTGGIEDWGTGGRGRGRCH